MFESICTVSESGSLIFTPSATIICTMISLFLGIIASLYCVKFAGTSKNFSTAIAVLPIIVQGVIMAVNGNLGYGVAVLGAFGLVRFRSAAGTSKEIALIFLAMAVGLIDAMGYIGYSVCLAAIVLGVMTLLEVTGFGESADGKRTLTVSVPENLDYEEVFSDIFEKYTSYHTLERVKTTNLGSMCELKYTLKLGRGVSEKEFIDAVRCRNGNLTVNLSRAYTQRDEL